MTEEQQEIFAKLKGQSYDTLCQTFVDLRETLTAKRKDFDEFEKLMKSHMVNVQRALMVKLNDDGSTSMKTDSGTAYIKERKVPMCEDWDAFRKYITAHGRTDMLQKRVAAGVITDFVEEAGVNPPGIKVDTIREVVVNKPRS